MALIFYLSSFHKLQASEVGWQDFIFRKTAHFTEYFILFVLFFRANSTTFKIKPKSIILWSLALTILYALSDEYHQTFVSGRTGKIFDISIDAIGAAAGAVSIKILPERISKIIL